MMELTNCSLFVIGFFYCITLAYATLKLAMSKMDLAFGKDKDDT